MRNCPVCDARNAQVIMEFTPELICMMNPTYNVDRFEEALRGKEGLLSYSQCRKCRMIYCEHCWDDGTLRRVYEDVIDHDKCKQKTYSIRKRLGQVQNWKNVLSLLSLMGRKELDNLKVVDYGCGCLVCHVRTRTLAEPRGST
jgi:hypothetical protein